MPFFALFVNEEYLSSWDVAEAMAATTLSSLGPAIVVFKQTLASCCLQTTPIATGSYLLGAEPQWVGHTCKALSP